MRRRYTTKIKKICSYIFIVFFGIGLVYSGFFSYNWVMDSKKINEQVNDIETITQLSVSETENSELVEQPYEIPSENPYWDYIKMNLINVDFADLKSKNSDTKGWIQVNGTNINYPFVQYSDNDYYLNRSFNKKKNSGGWIFLDYRNSIDELNKNTIIYGHSRVDTTMFGSLKNILNNGWLDNTNNHVIKMSTETENTLWQVISVYHIPVTSDYLQIIFSSEEEFINFSNMLIARSEYNFNTLVSGNDKLLTLSTCYNNDTERVVLHAKLIKKEAK